MFRKAFSYFLKYQSINYRKYLNVRNNKAATASFISATSFVAYCKTNPSLENTEKSKLTSGKKAVAESLNLLFKNLNLSVENLKQAIDNATTTIQKQLELTKEMIQEETSGIHEKWNQLCLLNYSKMNALENLYKDTHETNQQIESLKSFLNKEKSTLSIHDYKLYSTKLNDMSAAIAKSVKVINDMETKFEKLWPHLTHENFKSQDEFAEDLKLKFPDLDFENVLPDKQLNQVFGFIYSDLTTLYHKLLIHNYLEDREFSLKVLREKLEKEFEKDYQTLKHNYDEEIKNVMYQQSVAHAKHIDELLLNQQAELASRFGDMIVKNEQKIKLDYDNQLQESHSQLEKFEEVVKERTELEVAIKKSRDIWMMCQQLMEKLYGNFENSCKTRGPYDISDEIKYITVKNQEFNLNLNQLLMALPQNSLIAVWSKDQLQNRFKKTYNISRKLALCKSNESSPFKYMLSFAYSFVVFQNLDVPQEELNGTKLVDPSQWNNLQILSRVNYCVEDGNLEQALRYACLLTGKSREVALEWMIDVKQFLEVIQAVKAILARVSAIPIQAYADNKL